MSGLLSFLSKAADVSVLAAHPVDAAAAASATVPPSVQRPSTQQRDVESVPLAWRRTTWPSAAAASAQAAAAAAATTHLHRGSTAQQAPGSANTSTPAAKGVHNPSGASSISTAAALSGATDPRGGAAAAAAQLAARLLDAWADCGPGQLRSETELAATEAMADLLACLQLLLPHLLSLPGAQRSC